MGAEHRARRLPGHQALLQMATVEPISRVTLPLPWTASASRDRVLREVLPPDIGSSGVILCLAPTASNAMMGGIRTRVTWGAVCALRGNTLLDSARDAAPVETAAAYGRCIAHRHPPRLRIA
jgi:hypothetical protein